MRSALTILYAIMLSVALSNCPDPTTDSSDGDDSDGDDGEPTSISIAKIVASDAKASDYFGIWRLGGDQRGLRHRRGSR